MREAVLLVCFRPSAREIEKSSSDRELEAEIAGSKVNKTLSARTLGRRGVTRMRYFLCQASVSAAMLLIVKGWFKWVQEETWSQSGRFLSM